MARDTHSQFLEKLKGNPHYARGEFEVVSEYVDNSTPVHLRCRHGHTWPARPSNLKPCPSNAGTGCPVCAGTRRKTDEQFKRELAEKNPYVAAGLIEVVGSYASAHGRIAVRCVVCDNEWSPSAHSLLHSKSGCAVCNGGTKLTHEGFLERLGLQNAQYRAGTLIIQSEYVGAGKDVLYFCTNCGEYHTTKATVLLRGCGCPTCCVSSTSRLQEHVSVFFERLLGKDEVSCRDKKALGNGRELDVYLPRFCYAIEPGGWHWHMDKLGELVEKLDAAAARGIRLKAFLDECKKAERPPQLPSEVGWYRGSLYDEPGQGTLRSIELSCAAEIGLDVAESAVDWDAIGAEALERSMRESHELFLQRLSERNPAYARGDFEVLSRYGGDRVKLELRCNICGKRWPATAGSLISGTACPYYRKHPGWVSPRSKTKQETA